MYACVVCRVRDDWTGRGCKGCVWEGANERDRDRRRCVKRRTSMGLRLRNGAAGAIYILQALGPLGARKRAVCTWSALGVHSALNTSMMMRCASVRRYVTWHFARGWCACDREPNQGRTTHTQHFSDLTEWHQRA